MEQTCHQGSSFFQLDIVAFVVDLIYLCGVDFTPKITIRQEEKSRQCREEKRAMSGKFLPSLLYPPSQTAHFAWLCFLSGIVSKFLYVDFVFEFQGDTSLDYQAKCPNHARRCKYISYSQSKSFDSTLCKYYKIYFSGLRGPLILLSVDLFVRP